jgi:CheY-like chemotaxis protein
MSHELRTPLNSILILGQQLTDNPEGNLSQKQIEYSRTIHAAGTDLLNLISDILDLSKIESGTVTVEAEAIPFKNLIDAVARPFRHEAEARGLSFDVQIDASLGPTITTDSKRLQQVLKNLLSNAFKFTQQGGVWMRVLPAKEGWAPDHPVLSLSSSVVAFEVSDSGIGIAPDKQKIIFEAFQQADASTSRKYGGTGLGLAISRELSHLLGGEIGLRSTPGLGSSFTLYLPLHYGGPSAAIHIPASGNGSSRETRPALPTVVYERAAEPLPDDRANIQPGDAVLLLVEDDPHYGRVICDVARDNGFKVLIAMRGAEALELAQEYTPTAVSLDVFLPDMLGWTVLSQLKQNPLTRHIPVQIVTLDEDRQHGLARGAFSFISKPATTESIEAALSRIKDYAAPRRRRLLVIEDNAAEQLSIKELLGHDDVEIVIADTGAAGLELLNEERFDCVVLDLRLPDMSGFDVLEELRQDESLSEIPVVVFTGRELSPEEDAQLHSMARSIVVKGVESPERLLDETSLFLHRVVTELPAEKQQMIQRLHRSDEDLVGKTVLLVDDDARNIFALSSMLERRGMRVLTAATGAEAITLVKSTPELAIVLMDIMMPEMDGYQTMAAIREDPDFRRLPIIALTAKAMKGDREKSLDAGASEYLAKPVNTDQLLAAMRSWLHR